MQEPEESLWEFQEEYIRAKREEYFAEVDALPISFEEKQELKAEYDENLFG